MNININMSSFQLDEWFAHLAVEVLKRDFKDLNLEDEDRQSFLDVISFYTTHEEFRAWYENLD